MISELIKPKPSSKVLKWLRSYRDESLFLSSLTIGEIQRGMTKLPNSRKKTMFTLDKGITIVILKNHENGNLHTG
ncbi:MAG: hypothetical protein KJP23_06620 [Deltaproteobacteria bacterium]|nr:hypothetical protein [Deltaproteobacteria bacterium]